MRKKLISTLLVSALMVTALAGCGSSKESGADSSDTADKSSEAGTEAVTGTETGSSDVKDALKGVTLTIGTSGTYAPFSYFAEDGTTLQGFDIDFLYALQDVLGFTIADDTLQDMDYGPLTTSVTQGQLDVVAAALCATDERKENMNFTKTYYDAGIVVAVAEDNDDIKSVDDLMSGDYTVAIQSGTIAHEYAAANLPEDSLQMYDSQALAYKAVEGGQADATIYDAPGTAYSIGTGDVKLKIVGDEFYNGQAPYAIALSFDICKQYPDIVDDFDAAIDYLTQNGTIDKLKAKWCE